MNDAELNHLPPHERRRALQDYLKQRGLTSAPPAHVLTPEQILARAAMGIWDSVLRNVARPLLKSLPNKESYIPAGTQRLLMDSFMHKFNSLSKDELVMLVSIMHAEELEKQINDMVSAGMVGPDMDKPV